MKAKLIFRDKVTFADGAILEMILWELPEKNLIDPMVLSTVLHYGFPAKHCSIRQRARQGDHRHVGDKEEPYGFKDVETLKSDFSGDVEL